MTCMNSVHLKHAARHPDKSYLYMQTAQAKLVWAILLLLAHFSPAPHFRKTNQAHTHHPKGKAPPPIQHPDSLPCNTGAMTAVEEGLRHRRAPHLPLGDHGGRAGLAVPAPSAATPPLWARGAGELSKDILHPFGTQAKQPPNDGFFRLIRPH